MVEEPGTPRAKIGHPRCVGWTLTSDLGSLGQEERVLHVERTVFSILE